jgi:DNA-binding protein Fis
VVQRTVGSTSSSSNLYGVVDNNNNPYMNMVMDTIRMNQGHAAQCSIIDEESSVNTTKCFDFLKDSDELL